MRSGICSVNFMVVDNAIVVGKLALEIYFCSVHDDGGVREDGRRMTIRLFFFFLQRSDSLDIFVSR